VDRWLKVFETLQSIFSSHYYTNFSYYTIINFFFLRELNKLQSYSFSLPFLYKFFNSRGCFAIFLCTTILTWRKLLINFFLFPSPPSFWLSCKLSLCMKWIFHANMNSEPELSLYFALSLAGFLLFLCSLVNLN